MAILYQHRPAPQIRSTLAVFFVVGAALSLAGMGVAGALEWTPFLLALALTPCLLLGNGLARRLGRRLAHHHIRSWVLAVCASSAVVLLVRSLI
jgi:uncharacterized membrane protein YfcA